MTSDGTAGDGTASDRTASGEVLGPLELSYRRLLLAYPRAYRQERGDEIVGVLVDGAGPDQRRPRPREVVDLLAGGLRQRAGVNTRAGLADGLRVVFPLALALVAGLSVGVRVGGFGMAPLIQPYAYAWAVALIAWVAWPTAGRIAAVAAALFTVRVAAAWSYTHGIVFAMCLLGIVAAFAALAAPHHPATVEGRELGSTLWSWPGRLVTFLAGAGLGAVSFAGLTWWTQWMITASQLTVLGLAVVGAVVAVRRRGTSLLWAAALLSPAAVVLPAEDWPYEFRWTIDWREHSRPWLLLRSTLNDVAVILVPMLAATAIVALLVAAVAGRDRLNRASATLTRSTLVGFAGVVGALEVVGGVPSVPVLAGCVVLVLASLTVGLLPRAMVLAALAAGAVAVLTDASGPLRYGRPWPLYVLALLAGLVIAQSLLQVIRPRMWSTGLGGLVLFAVMAGYTLKHNRDLANLASYFSNAEHEPLFLVLPALAAAVVAVGLSAGGRPIRSSVTIMIGLAGLLWLSAPIRSLAVIGGVAAAGAVLVVLAARLGHRLSDRRRPNVPDSSSSQASPAACTAAKIS